MIDRTAQTPPLTLGQEIVAWWETSTSVSEPADLAERIDAELAAEYERGKRHGADDRKMIELQNQKQGREIDRLNSDIAKLRKELFLSTRST